MSPLLIALLEQLATTGAQIYANSQSATKAGDINKVIALAPMAFDIASSYQRVGQVLQQAQTEGWTDQDPRWDPIFVEADLYLETAKKLLV